MDKTLQVNHRWYFRFRTWHWIWIGGIVVLLLLTFWLKGLASPKVSYEIKKSSGEGTVVCVMVSSRFPISYTISPFDLDVLFGDEVIANASSRDNAIRISRGQTRRFVFDLRYDKRTVMTAIFRNALTNNRVSIRANIPVRILGMHFLIPYKREVSLKELGEKVLSREKAQ